MSALSSPAPWRRLASILTACRAILVGELPSLDAGEMTDKGSINQRAVLERRADLVAELYAPEPSPHVLVLDEGA